MKKVLIKILMWLLSKLVPVIKTPPPNNDSEAGTNGENIIKHLSDEYIPSSFNVPIHKKNIAAVEKFYSIYFINGKYACVSIISQCGATITFKEKTTDEWVVDMVLPIVIGNTYIN